LPKGRKAPAQPENFKDMLYQSAARGITAERSDRDTLYYGFVLRIREEDVGTPAQLEAEETALNRHLATQIEGMAPAVGAVIERYEVFDPDTGDMLVMMRFPYQEPPVVASAA